VATLRVTAGTLRGRRIPVPAGDVRPTSERARQAFFNIVGERIEGARFLDLFAGSGIFAFEAVSRGAESATAVERDRRAVEAILDAEIPVMGHIGLTPQSVNVVGGFKLQGKNSDDARRLIDEAIALEHAGCFSIVLECVPEELAAVITERVSIPTIGIGAGPSCDGQVLVFHDVLGMYDALSPKFVRRYGDIGGQMREAIAHYLDDVRGGRFPDAVKESFHMSGAEELKKLYGEANVLPMPKVN